MQQNTDRKRLATLTLAALGVVYGDIGTSPLYALKASLTHLGPAPTLQADILGVPVVRPVAFEATALGAGYLAGLAVGFWKSREEIAQQWRIERTFEPSMKQSQVAELRAAWHKALERAKNWAE